MPIKTKLVDQTLVVRLEGELDLSNVDDIRQELDAQLSRLPVRHVLLNLGKVSFLDSTGIGLILGRYRLLSGRGGRLVLAGVQPQVQRVLEMAGIPSIIRLYSKEPEALAEL